MSFEVKLPSKNLRCLLFWQFKQSLSAQDESIGSPKLIELYQLIFRRCIDHRRYSNAI